MYGFELLSDRMQQLFMAALYASERLSYNGGMRDETHSCAVMQCSMLDTPGTDVYVCRASGRVHECGARCKLTSIYASDSNVSVCPLTGMVRATQAKMIATGAWTVERDSGEVAGSGQARKRRYRDTIDRPATWAERDEATGRRTGNRVYWINEQKLIARRAPMLALRDGEMKIINACSDLIAGLYTSEAAERVCRRPTLPGTVFQVDAKAKEALLTVCQYARMLVIHSEPYARAYAQVDAVALCVAVLYTWMIGDGIKRPPAIEYSPTDSPWLAQYAPPVGKLDFLPIGGAVLPAAVFTWTDKFLQEVVSYWNEFARTATADAVHKRGRWVPVPVVHAVRQRLKLT